MYNIKCWIYAFRSFRGTTSMCSSATKGLDSCNYTTNSEIFYIRVLAYSELRDVTLKIVGVNNFEIQELEKDINIRETELTLFRCNKYNTNSLAQVDYDSDLFIWYFCHLKFLDHFLLDNFFNFKHFAPFCWHSVRLKFLLSFEICQCFDLS